MRLKLNVRILIPMKNIILVANLKYRLFFMKRIINFALEDAEEKLNVYIKMNG